MNRPNVKEAVISGLSWSGQDHGGLSIEQIAEKIGRSKSAVAAVIYPLWAAGVIYRKRWIDLPNGHRASGFSLRTNSKQRDIEKPVPLTNAEKQANYRNRKRNRSTE